MSVCLTVFASKSQIETQKLFFAGVMLDHPGSKISALHMHYLRMLLSFSELWLPFS